MSDQDWTKICGVCGDKAIAKNFGAVSCESCKAFFRRNASKLDVYKCYFDNKCKIDSVTRKFCRKCRLRKCFEIGMKQEWILSEEQKQIRRKKIEEKKQTSRKDSINSSNGSNSSHNIDTTPGSANETQDSDFNVGNADVENNISDEEIITNIMEIEKYIYSDDTDNKLADEENDESDDIIKDDVYQKAVELEFAVLPIARPMPENSNTLNEMECNRLIELFNAMTVWSKPPPEATKSAQMLNLNDVCQVMGSKMESDIRKLVNVSKGLSSFNNLCENDQISLLKYGSIEVMCLRSVLNFDFETNNWTLVLDDKQSLIMKLDMFKNGECHLYFNYRNYLRKIGKEWDSDSMIVDLLTAVVLFNPDRPNLIHKDMVKLQQQLYMYLLQRYLLIKYRYECESKEKFLKLLNTLYDLSALSQQHQVIGRQKNPEYLGPLVREVFDISA